MKRRLTILTRITLTLLLALLVFRLAWTTANTEFGAPFLTQQWSRATVGWFAETDPITAQSPSTQAEFWFAETERVLAEAGEDVHRQSVLSVGAAAVVGNLPGTLGYGDGYFIAHHHPRHVRPQGEWDGDVDAIPEYFARAEPRARELLRRALNLEPENVEWARIRATTKDFWEDESSPEDVWSECARVDPENALYDFLRAGQLLDDSIELDYYPDGWVDIKVIDETMVADAWDFIEQGLNKPFWIEEKSLALARLEFLQAANVPVSTHEVYSNHTLNFRHSGFVSTRICLLDLCWRAQLEARPRMAFEILQTLRQMWEHYAKDPGNARDLFNMEYAVDDARHMIDLMGWFPDAFTAKEVNAAKEYGKQLSEEYVTRDRAREQWRERYGTKDARNAKWGFAEVCYMFVLIAANPLLLLAGVFVLASMSNWVFRQHDDTGESDALANRRAIGWKMQCALWTFALAIPFIVLAVFPSRVDAARQNVIFLSTLPCVSLLFLCATAWRILRWKRFRFGLRTLLACFLVLPLLVYGIVQLCLWFVADELPDLGWEIELHEPSFYWAAITGRLNDTLLLVVQWLLRDGLVWMIGVWLGCTILVTLWRLRWANSEGKQSRRLLLNFAANASRNCAHGSLRMLVVVAFLYLAIVPNMIQEQDDRLEWIENNTRFPGRYWQQVLDISEELWADPTTRTEIRQQARRQLAKQLAPFVRL